MSGIRYQSAEDCPNAATHEPLPYGYCERAEAMEKLSKTRRQTRCKTCGFWTQWVKVKRTRKAAAPVAPKEDA